MPDPSYCRHGVFRATRRPEGTWSAGLLTTEGSDEDFMVRTGDILEAHVRLPVELGPRRSWPWLVRVPRCQPLGVRGHHPAPDPSTSAMSYEVSHLLVYRP